MALIIRCTTCGDTLEDSVDRTQAEAIQDLLDVGGEIEGDPADPDEIRCAACVRLRGESSGQVLRP